MINNKLIGIDAEKVINCLPQGVAVLGEDLAILWANQTFSHWFGGTDRTGEQFYSVLGNSDVQGDGKCQLRACFLRGIEYRAKLEVEQSSGPSAFYQLYGVRLKDTEKSWIYVTLSNVTEKVRKEQQLAAIHQAGAKLIDLRPDEIVAMNSDQQVELLKDRIRHYIQGIVNADLLEIRLLEQSSGDLIPLLTLGIEKIVGKRRLTHCRKGHGVDGYVAASGLSYRCRDTTVDPMFLESCTEARSSLTVPIILYDTVIGTINVESTNTDAFNESDQQFLEVFSRDIAVALNNLELLTAQRSKAVQEISLAICVAVALPLDDILLDAAFILDRYTGDDPEMLVRLRGILSKVRNIKKSIHQIVQKRTCNHDIPLVTKANPKLLGKRILVVDPEAIIRKDAHDLLEPYGCIVETALNGEQALSMVRNSRDEQYDVIISDVRLPDYSGYQLMLRLQKLMDHVPIALMMGFGYDPEHTIVKARQAGLHRKAILYKPLRPDRLLEVTETLIDYRPGRIPLAEQEAKAVVERAFGPVVLRIQDLRLAFGGNTVLSDVNGELRQGEVVLLMGPNGAGKSTLINALTGNISPDSGCIEYMIDDKTQRYSFPIRWWKSISLWNPFRPEFLARLGVGRSWQEVRLFESLSLKDNLLVASQSGVDDSPLAALGFGVAERSKSEALPSLGVEEFGQLKASKASLARSKQVAIARAIAAGAKVLFLDEPLSGIDRNGIVKMIEYLKSLIDEHRLTLVIIDHEFNWRHLLPLVTTSWELVEGKLTCQPAERVSAKRTLDTRDDWVQALIDAGDEVVEQDLPAGAKLTHVRISQSGTRLPALEVKGLKVTVGKRALFEDENFSFLSFTLNSGEISILEAPNGWGKTTLMRVLAGLQTPSSGMWSVSGVERPNPRWINCVPASAQLFPSLSVRETASVAGRPVPKRYEGMATRLCSSLSGGERQRLALSLATPKPLNVYDEPLNGLDSWQDFVKSCIEQAQSNQTVLVLVPKR
jgi:ABC-type multidrug transport system ATPase subunit/CheY-like chemotaxis protein